MLFIKLQAISDIEVQNLSRHYKNNIITKQNKVYELENKQNNDQAQNAHGKRTRVKV